MENEKDNPTGNKCNEWDYYFSQVVEVAYMEPLLKVIFGYIE